jgi:type IV pilus assembly protein PilO
MASKLAFKFDFANLQSRIQGQFSGLDPKDPASWPALPKYAAYAAVVALVILGLWFGWLGSYRDELETESTKEIVLRQDYTKKVVQAVNLEALKKQREQVQQYVTQLEKQLPSKAEMDALLSDVNQAGLGRSLQFDLFRPGQVVVREYYAELPISIRVTGRYHDIGAFASDVAQLSRIVTLNNISVSPVLAKDGTLAMDATAKTFRYLDVDEIAAQRKIAAVGGKK